MIQLNSLAVEQTDLVMIQLNSLAVEQTLQEYKAKF
jgi:hypothetical protein